MQTNNGVSVNLACFFFFGIVCILCSSLAIVLRRTVDLWFCCRTKYSEVILHTRDAALGYSPMERLMWSQVGNWQLCGDTFNLSWARSSKAIKQE